MSGHSSLHLRGAGHVLLGGDRDRGPVRDWADLDLRRATDLVIVRQPGRGWQVAWIGPAEATDRPATDASVDLGGGLLLPGLVDAHTHAVFAGDRSGEFTRRMAGSTYVEIAAEGGGIINTMRHTRAATAEQLADVATTRLLEMRAWGVRVVEIKTGYGLETAGELRMLRAIGLLQRRFAGRLQVVATAMPAHAVPPEFKGDTDRFVSVIREQILPAMAAEGTACPFVDIFIENGYFNVAQAAAVWQTARRLGFRLKAHVDEFADIGGIHWAVVAGAVSVEHLLVASTESIRHLAIRDTVAVCLPATSMYLRTRYAPMRALVDAGALVAVATDCNPGSAMTTNLPLAMQLAVLGGKLTAQESLRAATRGGALALASPGGYGGRLRVGEPFVATLLDVEHPDALFYELGAPPRANFVIDKACREPG